MKTEYKARKYPLRETFIDIIIKASNEAHPEVGVRLMDALHTIKELVRPDYFEQQHDQLADKLVDAIGRLLDEHYRDQTYPTNEQLKQTCNLIIKS